MYKDENDISTQLLLCSDTVFLFINIFDPSQFIDLYVKHLTKY